MRTPSEPRALKWSDIDWERNTILVNASKTEHHGDGQRTMPLFPELVPYLQELRAEAEPGAVFVFRKLQDKGYNPATHMRRIVSTACGTAWPKVFQNCRSTRQTELCQKFPNHVVASWLRNSTRIAEQFYLQTTEEQFLLALEGEAIPEAVKAKSDQLKQNPKQQAAATSGTEMQNPREDWGSANRYVPVPITALHWNKYPEPTLNATFSLDKIARIQRKARGKIRFPDSSRPPVNLVTIGMRRSDKPK